MPDSGRGRRLAAAFGALLAVGAAIAAPAALAQEAPQVSDPTEWRNSALGTPFAGSTATVSKESFAINGRFVKDASIGERIVSVDVSFSDGSEGTTPPDPDTTPPAVRCVPEDPDPFGPSGPRNDENKIVFPFAVSAEQSLWPCNGTYQVTASARSNQEANAYDLTGTLRVAVPPVAVPSMEATVAGGEEAPDPETGATADDPASVIVTWEELVDPDDKYPDFVGYRVQRAGPADDSAFATVSDTIVHGTTNRFNDTIEAPGEYRYRVQSLRTGPDGPGTTIASADDTPAVTVDIAAPPPTTTTTTEPQSNDPTTSQRTFGVPAVDRSPSTGSRLTVPTTQTTIDTGFDENLDYGDLPEPGDELAGEGQSVIQTEGGEGAGLLGPVAGAMVLLGWAGHVAYLNRLAKQF